MDDMLFDLTPHASPRKRWMDRYEVHTELGAGRVWCAWSTCSHDRTKFKGETEDDAIGALAQARGWKLWNEEEPL